MPKKLIFTTNKKHYSVRIRAAETNLVTGPNGKIKATPKKAAIHLKIAFMEKCDPTKEAKKLNDLYSTDITPKEITDILVEKEKKTSSLWIWESRPADKTQKNLESEIDVLKEENEKKDKKLSEYRALLEKQTTPEKK